VTYMRSVMDRKVTGSIPVDSIRGVVAHWIERLAIPK